MKGNSTKHKVKKMNAAERRRTRPNARERVGIKWTISNATKCKRRYENRRKTPNENRPKPTNSKWTQKNAIKCIETSRSQGNVKEIDQKQGEARERNSIGQTTKLDKKHGNVAESIEMHGNSKRKQEKATEPRKMQANEIKLKGK